MNDIRFPASVLIDFARALLVSGGVPDALAQIAADSLVAANLRGVDSHGIQMLLPYLDQLEAGSMDGKAEGSPLSEDGGCMLYDGENGLGQVVADRCVTHAVRLVHEHGLAVVSARNSNHFGTAAYWAQKLAAQGCVSIVTCNASSAVPPWPGIEPRIGTNPICMAVPGSESGAWLLDMATTTVALGKIYAAHYRGEATIPAGWAMDAKGVPTTDTTAALAGLPTPLGGYKGSGLGLMAELLSAGLSGGPMATDVGSLRRGFEPLRISHVFLAIDVRRFLSLSDFGARLQRLTAILKSTPTAPGHDEVLVAGEPEWRMLQERTRIGIPIPAALYESLSVRAQAAGISMPPQPARSSAADAPRQFRLRYQEDFDAGPGGWCGWIDNLRGPKALEIRDGAAIARSPWWIDYNHAPPGAGYLHLPYILLTGGGAAHTELYVETAGRNRFIEQGLPTNFTNATLTVRLRGEILARQAHLVLLAQATVNGTTSGWALTGRPIRIDETWSEQAIVIEPDPSLWTCLGSRHDRTQTYGFVPLAEVLRDVNADIMFIFFPLDVQPMGKIEGDPHRLRAGKDYPVWGSRLPEGYLELDRVCIEFPANTSGEPAS